MDQEFARLQEAGALNPQTEKLIERQVLMDLSDEYPSLGEELLKKLVIEPASHPPGEPPPAPELGAQ